MPVHTQISLDEGDHVVQFYDCDDDLVDVVVGYLAAALADGDAVVVIATPAHRAAFMAALEAARSGSSVADDDRLVVLDAEDTLSAFMDARTPDSVLFDAVVGETVRGLAAAGRPVRAYGEMVAVLWGAGNREAALELERLWNGLGATLPFSLFCGYPSHMVSDGVDALAEVCSLHSQVVAGTPTNAGTEEVRRLVRSPDTPRLARRFVSETLLAWGFGELDDAAVVATELAANAVTHAESDVTVSLMRTDGGVRIAVADRSSVLPVIRASDRDSLGGRGLLLVDNLAERWGHAITDDGKVVWADLSVSTLGVR